MIFIIAAISVIAFLVLAVCCYKRRSQAQVFNGIGPKLYREEIDNEPINSVNELSEEMVEIPLTTEDDPLLLNGTTTTYNGHKKKD